MFVNPCAGLRAAWCKNNDIAGNSFDFKHEEFCAVGENSGEIEKIVACGESLLRVFLLCSMVEV